MSALPRCSRFMSSYSLATLLAVEVMRGSGPLGSKIQCLFDR